MSIAQNDLRIFLMDFSYKLIDGTHCMYNGHLYHIAQLTPEMIATLKSAGCKFHNDRFFRLQDSYVVNVGNLGNVCDTEDFESAKLHFEEYVRLSKSGYGRVAGECVIILCNGEPMPDFEYYDDGSDNDNNDNNDDDETPNKTHWCGYQGYCGEEDCNCCESNPRNPTSFIISF